MSSGRPSSSTLVGKKSKKMASSSKPNAVSLQDKLQMVENEEQVVLKHIHDLNKWVSITYTYCLHKIHSLNSGK